jgi:isoleucyl-tRNA synthetase
MVRNIQELRKTIGLDISDRIAITYHTESALLAEVFQTFGAYIAGETLAVLLEAGSIADGHEIQLGDATVRVKIEKVG